MGCGYFLCLGWCYGCGWPRHRCVVSCAGRTRCVTARGSVGVRLWLFLRDAQEMVEGQHQVRAAGASPAVFAAAEACEVVIGARGLGF